MTEADAEEVIGWRYPGEYSFYDIERDVEDMAELRAAHVREEKYFSVLSDGELLRARFPRDALRLLGDVASRLGEL